jgi:hypothetical protein
MLPPVLSDRRFYWPRLDSIKSGQKTTGVSNARLPDYVHIVADVVDCVVRPCGNVEAAPAGPVWESGSISGDSARPGTPGAKKVTAAARTTTGTAEAGFRTTAPGLVEFGMRARTPSTTRTRARLASLKQRRERQRQLPTPQRAVDGLRVAQPRQRAARRDGVDRAASPRLGDEQRSPMAPEKRRLPEPDGKPNGPGERLLAGAGTITRAQRVVQVVQGPAAAGAAKVLANAVRKKPAAAFGSPPGAPLSLHQTQP